jgi:hypothetical protein
MIAHNRAMRFVAGVVVLLALVRPARADLAGSVYDDIRDVVEELIQTEVTTSVVATIEHRSPALAFYMHGTLERLASPYWGSLGRALKDDLTVAVADFVYWHLSSGAPDGDVVASARRFFGCVKTAADPACLRLVHAIAEQKRPLIEVECRRTKPGPDRRVACDIGLAVLAALQKRGEVRHHVLDALADIVLDDSSDSGPTDRLRETLAQWVDLPKDLPLPLIESLANKNLDFSDAAIDTLCNDPKLIDNVLHQPLTSAGWICFAVTHSSLPGALGAKVTISDAGHTADLSIDYWIIEAALHDFDAERATDDSSFRMLADIVFDQRCPPGGAIDAWPCKGARLQPGATVTVEWLGRQIVGTVDAGGQFGTKPSKAMLVWTLRFRKALNHIEELRTLVPPALAPYVFFHGAKPKEARSTLRALVRVSRLVAELRSRWYLWTKDGTQTAELDVAELLHAARDAMGPPAAGSMSAKALAFLDKQPGKGASTLDIGDWLRLVMRGDYRALAMESMRAALNLPLHATNRPHETFFVTLGAYLLDAGEGVDETVARSAFKASAKELLLSATHKGVPRADDRFRFRVLPVLGMRLAFSEEYSKTDSDARRTLVSADWPTMMLAFTDNVGLEASVIDPVAPLAELALRPSGVYHDEKYVALDALRPRLGIWFAVPQLSRRLTVSTGFGARFVRLDKEADGIYRYRQGQTLAFDLGIGLVF